MEVSYATMIAMGTLVQRLGRDARRLEKALAETMNASAEWRRIVDELKAERDAERKAHNEYKERNRELFNQNQRLTAELVVIKDERDALRAQLDTERERHKQTAAILAQYAPKTVDVPRAHPVKVGEWVMRTSREYPNTKIGAVAQVVSIDADGDYQVAINGVEVCWSAAYCTPCDPPREASPAEGAVEPKPGDVVRLVREPTHTDIPAMLPWSKAFGMPGDTATVVIMAIPDKLPNGTIPVRTSMGRCFFWPISCIEIVEDAK